MKISKYFNLPDFNVNLLDTAIVKTFIRLIKQKYISYTRIANLRCCAGLWVSTKFNRASLQILYVHVYAIDIERKRH